MSSTPTITLTVMPEICGDQIDSPPRTTRPIPNHRTVPPIFAIGFNTSVVSISSSPLLIRLFVCRSNAKRLWNDSRPRIHRCRRPDSRMSPNVALATFVIVLFLTSHTSQFNRSTSIGGIRNPGASLFPALPTGFGRTYQEDFV